MLWHEQTWPDLERISKDLPVVIPIGSCEQHGHHLPVFVDTMTVAAVAEAVEKRLAGQMLLTPALWLGSSHHHMDFPGAISLRPSLYAQVIQDVVRSILKSGFRRVFLLNGHGGNLVPAQLALTELTAVDDTADGATLVVGSWWQVAAEGVAAERHAMASPRISHACEYETSLILHVRPDLVDAEAIKTMAPHEPPLENRWTTTQGGPTRVATAYRFCRRTSTGHMGKPEHATAEKGSALLAAAVDEVEAFVKEFATWPLLPVIGPK